MKIESEHRSKYYLARALDSAIYPSFSSSLLHLQLPARLAVLLPSTAISRETLSPPALMRHTRHYPAFTHVDIQLAPTHLESAAIADVTGIKNNLQTVNMELAPGKSRALTIPGHVVSSDEQCPLSDDGISLAPDQGMSVVGDPIGTDSLCLLLP